MGAQTGIQWTDHTCRPCGVRLTTENTVEVGRRLCKACKNERARARYEPTGPPARYGPPPAPPRDDDRRQARQRINVEVRTGRRPHPNSLPCADCGHAWRDGERRHEYDHHLGYAAEHHHDVEPVCTTCHAERERRRGVYARRRAPARATA